MANPLREIVALFDVDTTGVEQGVKKSDGLIGKLTGSLKGVAAGLAGAFAVGAIVNFGKAVLAETDATAKLAGTLGMGISELQGWQHAANLSGIQSEMLTMSLNKLGKATADAAAGQGPAAALFKRLGVEAQDSEKKLRPVGDVLTDVLSELQAMEDPVARNAMLMGLFGEQGTKMVPLLEAGTEGIAAMRAEVEALGAGMSEEFAKNAQDFNDDMARMELGFKGLMIQGLGPLLPGLTELMQIGTGFLKSVIGITKEMGGWLQQTKLLEAGLALLTVKGVAMLVAGLGKAITGIGGVRMAFMRLLPFLFKVLAPMLILEDLFIFLAGGQSAFGAGINKIFGDGKAESFRETILDILKDLKDGKIGDALTKTFSGIGTMFAAIGDQMMAGFVKLWNEIVEKSGKLGSMLGLEKIDPSEFDRENQSAYERERDKADRIRKGEETPEERRAREGFIPGAADMAKGVQGLGSGAAAIVGQPESGMLTGGFGKDGKLELSRLVEALEEHPRNFVEAYQNHVEVMPSGGMHAQDIQNDVKMENTVHVHVPPGTDADVARRVGGATTRAVRQGIDTNALLGALVPQPAR